ASDAPQAWRNRRRRPGRNRVRGAGADALRLRCDAFLLTTAKVASFRTARSAIRNPGGPENALLRSQVVRFPSPSWGGEEGRGDRPVDRMLPFVRSVFPPPLPSPQWEGGCGASSPLRAI